MSLGRREITALRFQRQAFSLIELLVVIAIITILTAIAFPVFARARLTANRNSDISNLNSLRNALQLYQADQGGYPPALLGYVSPYQSGPVTMSLVIPADQLKAALVPRRIPLNNLRPALNKETLIATTTAVWPAPDPRAVGTAPILDLNGDGGLDALDDPVNARQQHGPASGYVKVDRSVTSDPDEAANFYSMSGYDVAEVLTPAGRRTEVHYSLFWTTWGLGGGNSEDDPRQLGYTDPPESTVITWDSYFRQYKDDLPQRQRHDIVLFIGGGAKPYDSRDVSERSWRIMPQ